MSARDPLAEEEIRAMLAYVPADERETWVRMGMAVKAELGDAGFDLWDAWSQSADNYDARAARDTWRSIKDGPVGIGTLVHLAKENGWQPDRPMPATRRAKPTHVSDFGAPEKPAEPSPTQAYAREIWDRVSREDHVVGSHPYAIKKGITHAAGAGRARVTGRLVGRDADCLVIPVRTLPGELVGVECINPAGAKQSFGSKGMGCLILGNTLDKNIPWAVVEGWADAATFVFHWHRGNAVAAAAFGKGRMEPVAHAIDEYFGPREVLIIGDAK
jgi:hypothetical protein